MMGTFRPPQDSVSLDYQQTNVISIDNGRQITYAEYGHLEGVPVVFYGRGEFGVQVGGWLHISNGPTARSSQMRLLTRSFSEIGDYSPKQ